jgi:hypothetical protein
MTDRQILYLCILCFFGGGVLNHFIGYHRFIIRSLRKVVKQQAATYAEAICNMGRERETWRGTKIVLQESVKDAGRRLDELQKLADTRKRALATRAVVGASVKNAFRNFTAKCVNSDLQRLTELQQAVSNLSELERTFPIV